MLGELESGDLAGASERRSRSISERSAAIRQRRRRPQARRPAVDGACPANASSANSPFNRAGSAPLSAGNCQHSLHRMLRTTKPIARHKAFRSMIGD